MDENDPRYSQYSTIEKPKRILNEPPIYSGGNSTKFKVKDSLETLPPSQGEPFEYQSQHNTRPPLFPPT